MAHVLSRGNILRILFVEDDDELSEMTASYLEAHQMQVTRVRYGLEALAITRHSTFDVVLLDLGLPDKDGLAVCLELRSRGPLPIVLLTARGQEGERVLGLEAGADDYVSKPFSARELVARIRALARRSFELSKNPAPQLLRAGSVTLCLASRTGFLHGQRLELTTDEFSLLKTFVQNAGRVLSRQQLLDQSRTHSDEVFLRAIDIQISRLRTKLGDNARRPQILKTVRGAGYLLSDSVPV